jgi:hypothetical protein
MDLGTVLEALGEAGLSVLGLAGALVRGLLLWGLVGLVVSLLLFFGLRRLGWLDAGPARTRWARVLFGLVLFLVFWPAATGAGVTFSLRRKVSAIVLEQCHRLRLTDAVGQLALVPVVAGHGALAVRPASLGARAARAVEREGGLKALLRKEGRKERIKGIAARSARRLREQLDPEADVSFLLDADRNRQALAQLSGGMARRALERVGLPAGETWLGRLTIRLLERYAGGSLEEKLAFYQRILGELEPGPGGGLTWREAGRQVGGAFLRTTLLRTIARPFDALCLKLLLLALLPPLVVLVTVRIVALARRRRPPTARA